MPDPAAFVALIEQGLADPAVVSAAYEQALGHWLAGRTYSEIFAGAVADGGIGQSRSEIDMDEKPSLGAELIRLHRRNSFKGDDR